MIWEEIHYGTGWNGFMPLEVGRTKLATITYDSNREHKGRPWVLRTRLPGWTQDRRFATDAIAKEAALRILARFMEAATAALGEEKTDEV